MVNPPSDRATVRRLPKRAAYDYTTIHSILDAGLVCHLGFMHEDMPFVIPTLYGRLGDHVYIHGSTASRLVRELSTGMPVCLTVTLLDGLVLARSAFHHSMNYRSVVLLGSAQAVIGTEAKLTALEAITEHVVPGRWADARRPNAQELKATSLLTLSIEEASAKIRTGGPLDDEEDFALPVWAGEIPMELVAGVPQPDARLDAGIPYPEYLRRFQPGGDRIGQSSSST
jgi:nitroimidazol reductase NimA-like FMN-containing flavoprotein (pyridoxamine 5'-phosphate oxidase superfamily)